MTPQQELNQLLAMPEEVYESLHVCDQEKVQKRIKTLEARLEAEKLEACAPEG